MSNAKNKIILFFFYFEYLCDKLDGKLNFNNFNIVRLIYLPKFGILFCKIIFSETHINFCDMGLNLIEAN